MKRQPIPHVTDLRVMGDYTLRLTFDDGLVGDVDLSDLPGAGPAFDGLQDRDYFAKACIHPKARTVSWPGGPTLAPEGLYEDAARCVVITPQPRPHYSLLANMLRALTRVPIP